MKKMILFLFVCSSIFAAPVIYVNSVTGNDAAGDGSFGNPYKTFTKGYNMASSGSMLDLTGTFDWSNADETGDIFLTPDLINVYGFLLDKNITIQGHGAGNTIIQAASSDGIAEVGIFTILTPVNVTINDVELRYGKKTVENQWGGAIFASSNTGSAAISINNCYIHNNTANRGGAMYISSPFSLSVTNSTFSYNTASAESNTADGGAIECFTCTSSAITNSTFAHNTAGAGSFGLGYGGAIFYYSGTHTITNCTIAYNITDGSGGGIEIEGNDAVLASLYVKNTLMALNNANGYDRTGDFDHYEGTLYDNGYNVVLKYYNEYGTSTGLFNGTGTMLGDAYTANIMSTLSNTLALNNASNGIQTLKLTSGSVAINNGNMDANNGVAIPTTDQRGALRNGATDIGAYEYWNNDGALPVELTSFTASIIDKGVELKWTTATEQNNYGFEIERASFLPTEQVGGTTPGQGGNTPLNPPDLSGRGDERGVWEKIGFVHGAGNSNSPKEYSFIDTNLIQGNAQYRLKQIDLDGNYKYYSQLAEVNFSMTDVKEKQLPKEFSLSQNYPNPFNPTTTISYSIPGNPLSRGVRGVSVTLKVYDMLGKEVSTLVNETKAPGYYEVKFDASNLSTGIYFYRLTAGSFTSTKKLMLIK